MACLFCESSTSRVGLACERFGFGIFRIGVFCLAGTWFSGRLFAHLVVGGRCLRFHAGQHKKKRDSVCVCVSFNKDCHPLV